LSDVGPRKNTKSKIVVGVNMEVKPNSLCRARVNKGGMKANRIEWMESGIIGVNSGVASGGRSGLKPPYSWFCQEDPLPFLGEIRKKKRENEGGRGRKGEKSPS
jgi:hypothetical protein